MATDNLSNQVEMFKNPTPAVASEIKVLDSISKPRMILGNHVATERLKTTEIKHEKKAGIAFVENKHSLDRLEVKYDSECIPGLKKGHHVFIRQNNYNSAWSAQYYVVDGEEFILVPRDAIVLVEFN